MKIKVGIIDSGLGGKHTADTIRNYLSRLGTDLEIYRYRPTTFESYATSSIQRLFTLCDTHLKYLNEKIEVDVVIVACMTLSTNCLEYIRSKCKNKIPVMDLYTGLPYLDNDTVVFATPNTIKSGRFAYSKEIPCTRLSSVIEINGFTDSMCESLLDEYVKQAHIEPIGKTIVLGCSHYSIIEYIFERMFQPRLIINPVDRVTLQLAQYIEDLEEEYE